MPLGVIPLNIEVSYEIGITHILIFIGLIVFILFKLRDKRLKKAKNELERLVEERTAALKHKEQEVMDSIRYALRIQLSIIPTQQHVKSLLPKSMIYYRPKDIVSGDFYWVDEADDKVFFCSS
jgi:hypothetical protein